MSILIFIIFENSTKPPKMSENVWLTPQMRLSLTIAFAEIDHPVFPLDHS